MYSTRIRTTKANETPRSSCSYLCNSTDSWAKLLQYRAYKWFVLITSILGKFLRYKRQHDSRMWLQQTKIYRDNTITYEDMAASYPLKRIKHSIMDWRYVCKKQVSRMRTSNHTSQYLRVVITFPCPWYLLLVQSNTVRVLLCFVVVWYCSIPLITFRGGGH